MYLADPVMVEMLLKYGADVTKKDKEGFFQILF